MAAVALASRALRFPGADKMLHHPSGWKARAQFQSESQPSDRGGPSPNRPPNPGLGLAASSSGGEGMMRDFGYRKLLRAAQQARDIARAGGMWGIESQDQLQHFYIEAKKNPGYLQSRCGRVTALIVKAPDFRRKCARCEAIVGKNAAPPPNPTTQPARGEA